MSDHQTEYWRGRCQRFEAQNVAQLAEIERLKDAREKAATEETLLRADNERLLGLLIGMVDLAEYWIGRDLRPNMSKADFDLWHNLGYGSKAYRQATAALADQPSGGDK